MVGNAQMTSNMWNQVDPEADYRVAGQNSDLPCPTVFLGLLVIMGMRCFYKSHCMGTK